MSRITLLLGFILFTNSASSSDVEDFVVSSLECGGVLEGEQGQLNYPLAYEQTNSKTCIWIVKLVYRQGIQFQLKQLSNSTSVNVYSQEDFKKDGQPLSLNSSSIGSTFDFPGTTIVIILPDIEAHLSFQWASMYEDNLAQLVSTNYIISPQGHLSWRPFGRLDSLLWILNLDDINGVEISLRSAFTCCPSNSCLSLRLFEVTAYGLLNEITRFRGSRTYGVYESGTSQVLAFSQTDKASEGNLEITWSPAADASGCTLPTTVRPIEPTTTEIIHTTVEPESDPILAFGAVRAPSDLAVNIFSVASGNVTSIPTLFQARAVSFDAGRQEIYWGDSCCRSNNTTRYGIYRAHIDGSNVEQIKDFGDQGVPKSISYDWINENIYFIDSQSKQIGVCSRDGSGCAIIIYEDEIVPGYITADPVHGKLYWSAPDSKNIFISNLDGTDINVLIQVPSGAPFRMTVNYEDSRLYWVDVNAKTIESVNLEGTDHKILHNTTFRPHAVAVDRSHIYWTTSDNNGTIQRIDKGSLPTEEEIIWYGSGVIPHDLAIFSSNQQPYVDSPCRLKSCSHICVPHSFDFRCICPEGLMMQGDQRNCM